MQRSTSGGSAFDDGQRAEAGDTGGADDVQKTSYVVGHGTDPDASHTVRAAATVRSGTGFNLGVWIVGAIAVLIALVYGIGVFR